MERGEHRPVRRRIDLAPCDQSNSSVHETWDRHAGPNSGAICHTIPKTIDGSEMQNGAPTRSGRRSRKSLICKAVAWVCHALNFSPRERAPACGSRLERHSPQSTSRRTVGGWAFARLQRPDKIEQSGGFPPSVALAARERDQHAGFCELLDGFVDTTLRAIRDGGGDRR